MNVWLLDWSARMETGRIFLKAKTPELEVELELSPRKPVVLHGERGLSRKGPAPGQASHYASYTDLASRGTLRSGPGAKPIAVTGTSWFDQEFGSNQLSREQVGWDWLGLHLSDGRDLMLYLLRRSDGTLEPASSGTLVEPDGRARHVSLEDVSLQVLGRWTSLRTKTPYPSRWRLTIPSAGIDLELSSWLSDQELRTEASTGVTYWEGAVGGRGTSGGRPVACEGYAELTGYAGRMGGVF
jgi:predicted secreted hydrolase